MTVQAKNTAYEVSKAEELGSTNQAQSASVFSPIGAFFTRHRSLALSLASVLSVLVIWYLITALKIVPSLFLPSPQAVWQKFLEVSQQGFMKATLWQHLAASISRVLLALVAAMANSYKYE
jgi:taurine transport system permease protein